MPTIKPQLKITFEPEQFQLLKRLSTLEEKPMSKVVKDLFEHVQPMLTEMVVALEAARAAQGKAPQQLLSSMARLNAAVQTATQAAVDQGDMFSGHIARVGKKLEKRAGRPKQGAVRKRKRARAS